ncbi:TPA: hypothetical protein HIQ84_001869 [Escherichia coli]|nr:hypothetical protein [Escherichia coli]HAH8847008.1 hypothetical protein [Escherichia coli]
MTDSITTELAQRIRHWAECAVLTSDRTSCLSVEQLDEIADALEMKKELQPAEVSNEMAVAFFQALTDDPIGVDDIEECKVGLRAAFANVPAPAAQPLTVKLPSSVSYADLDASSKDREVIEAIAECKGWNAFRTAMIVALAAKGITIAEGE